MTLTPSVHPSARTMPKGTAKRSPSPAKAVALNERGLDAVYWFMPQLIDYARFVLALPLVLLLPPAGAPEAADMRLACAVCYVFSHLLDFVDGRVARAYDQCSHFGILLDHTLDIMTTAFMWAVLVSETPSLLQFVLFDCATYVPVVMLLINRAIQNGRFRGVLGVPDGIAGKWSIPYCVENGGFLVPGHGACASTAPATLRRGRCLPRDCCCAPVCSSVCVSSDLACHALHRPCAVLSGRQPRLPDWRRRLW